MKSVQLRKLNLHQQLRSYLVCEIAFYGLNGEAGDTLNVRVLGPLERIPEAYTDGRCSNEYQEDSE